jgi:hypothetical protein
VNNIRKQWLKTFFRSHNPRSQWKKYEDIDSWSDEVVDETINQIYKDLKRALKERPMITAKSFDEDFVEYLQEEGYADDHLDVNIVAIEFAEWSKEAVSA